LTHALCFKLTLKVNSQLWDVHVGLNVGFPEFRPFKTNIHHKVDERDHLKSEPQTAELEQRVFEIRKLKPYASLRDIAAELGTNQVRVKRILDRNKHKFEP
jgi:hypothetical protein